MKIITVQDAQKLVQQGALLVDVRDMDEFGREHIEGAQCIPCQQLGQSPQGDKKVIFYCASGMRTKSQQGLLENLSCEEAFILDGGLKAWQAAGLPVLINKKQPLPLQRQVQIGAGSLIVLAMLLGYFVNPAFVLIAAFVGVGLVFAGLTGFCGMAVLLIKMPWNKHLRGSNQTSCSI